MPVLLNFSSYSRQNYTEKLFQVEVNEDVPPEHDVRSSMEFVSSAVLSVENRRPNHTHIDD